MCEMEALYRWTKNHYRYVSDPVNAETISTPPSQFAEIDTPPEVLRAILGDDLIQRMQGFGVAGAIHEANVIECPGCFRHSIGGIIPKTSGDCDEGVTLLASMAASIGIVPRFHLGGYTSESEDSWSHIWNGLQHNMDWVNIDLTEDFPIGEFYHGFTVYGHYDIFPEAA